MSAAALDSPPLRRRVVSALAAVASIVFDDVAPDVELVGADRGAIRAAAARGARVLAIVPAADRRTVDPALGAGADGAVLETELDDVLAAAVIAVARGLLVLPAASRRAVGRPVLSSREKQILSMVVVGQSNAQIARRLQLAESTVKSHLSAILGKLGVRSRQEAADLILDPRTGLGDLLPITPPRPSTRYARPTVL